MSQFAGREKANKLHGGQKCGRELTIDLTDFKMVVLCLLNPKKGQMR